MAKSKGAENSSVLARNSVSVPRTAVGYQALRLAAGDTANTAVGYKALTTATTGSYNTALGYNAGTSLTIGESNTLLGVSAGGSITDGLSNIAVGGGALAANVSGNQNTAIGVEALNGCTLSANVAVGDAAMRLVGGVVANVIVGAQSAATATGATFNSNVGVGYHVFEAVAAGTVATCVAVGREALKTLTAGSNNVAIGGSAASTLTAGSNIICIGESAEPSSATASNEVTIGKSAITRVRFAGGTFDIPTMSLESWTPIDSSGAGLALTVVADGCKIRKIGQLVIASIDVTYPVTASGAAAKIGGLLYTSMNSTNDVGGGALAINNAVAAALTVGVNLNATTLQIYAGATAKTNVQMSAAVVRGTFMYLAAA